MTQRNSSKPERAGGARRSAKRRHTAIERLFVDLAHLVAPPPDLTVSQWAEAYRFLSPESSAEPGKYHCEKTPFAAAIMDAFTDPRVERVVVMSSAQVAKTTIIENVLGYFMHYDPCPIMVVQPTDDMYKAFAKERFAPMVRDTPVLSPLVKDNKSKDGNNTVSSKSFPGGHLALVSAKSDAQVQSRPRRVVLFDEVDRYESYSPIGHGIMRTNRFWNRKVGLFSTPDDKDTSKIEPEYNAGTMEQWQLPCPHCGAYQPLYFNDQLDHATLQYACKACGAQSGEFAWKAGTGQWVARQPLQKCRSFHLNAMISPGLHWDEIVEKFHYATKKLREGDKEPYKNFITQILGESFEEKGETLEADAFAKNRHWYGCDVPAGVLLLTAAADTQNNRVEIEVRGWGKGFETWGIQYLVIPGTMDMPEMRAQIDALLNKVWVREDGVPLTIARYVQDSGGHYTDEVYSFTRPRAPRVFAVHGSSQYADPLVGRISKKLRKGKETPLFTLGVNVGKEMVFNRLQVEHVGPGFHHWPMEVFMSDGVTPRGYDEQYFQQLTNEKRVTRYSRGARHNAWVPKRESLPVEAWDILVYNLAALYIYGPQALEAAAAQEVTGRKPPTPPVARGRRVLSSGIR